jgi:hypothetical protein
LLRVASFGFILMALHAHVCLAQCGGGGGGRQRQSVGGVSIDADGVLSSATIDQSSALREVLTRSLHAQAADLRAPTELRKVSLRRLDEAIEAALQSGEPLSDDVQYLAGLQSIRYVLAYPEDHDVVLVGYGEAWTVDKQGFVVGENTGRPVLLLDDLLVAWRAAQRSGDDAITCSIDPTQAGLANLRQYVGSLSRIADVSLERIEQSLGAQTITIAGIPLTSHFARVLVAADYKMKRLGMKLDPSPVAGLPSYLDLVSTSGRGMQDMTPRWWLTPAYLDLLSDPEGLAWELRGSSVVVMTEDTLFAADGSKTQTGKTSTAGQQWAALMTRRYEALAAKEPIFAQLRYCMDLAVVAALIRTQRLTVRAGCPLAVLLDPSQLPANELAAPRFTPSRASVLKKGSNFVISASGGVEIHPREMLEKTQISETLHPVYDAAQSAERTHWWWN